MTKKIFAIILMVMMFCCGCGRKKVDNLALDTLEEIINRDNVVVGVKTDAYPFGYFNKSGNFAGYDVELGKLIAKGLLGNENKVKFVSVTASDRMMKLYANDVDMLIATMSVTPRRQDILDFSNSYYTSGQSLLVRRGSSVKNIRDLNGKKVIIVFGSTAENSVRAAVPNAAVVGYKTYSDAYKALKAGRADAILSDNSILTGIALNDKDVVLLNKKYSKEPYAVAFKKGEDSKNLIKAVNDIIDIETKNGTLKKYRKEFGIK